MFKFKKIIVTIIIVIILVLVFSFLRNSSRTVYNKENAFGNTAGNLFNGGLFCELSKKIYFSNPKDNGTLYEMDLEGNKFKKLRTDQVTYINATGNYIYYVMNNVKRTNVFAFNNVGIYRITLKGNGIKMLYDNPSGLINVYGNSVYYQHFIDKEGLTFYSVSIDGSKEKMISEEAIIPASIASNSLFYIGTAQDKSIKAMDLKSGLSTTIYNGNCYAPIVNNKFIYYMSLDDNYAIYRINLDGSNPTPVVAERCSTYNITADGKYLYYQVDDAVNNRICIMNLQTGVSNTIMTGNYKEIHITSNFVFFNIFSDDCTYYLPVGSSKNVTTFNPPNLSK